MDKIIGQNNKPASEFTSSDHEILVSRIKRSVKAKPQILSESDLVKDYANETKIKSHINLAQGLAIGASAGIIVCIVAVAMGLTLNTKDLFALIGVPSVLGFIAGYIFS